jgi:5'(3')-deoxyribonucleotidase
MADANAFVLGVDLDGVCADFYTAMRPVVADWLGVADESLIDDFSYGLAEWGVRDIKHYKSIHRHAVTQRRLFLEMRQVPGAGPALRRLSDDGVHVRVITHRLFIPHFHQEAVRQTVEWLDREGIPYWDLCFVKDKVEVGADLYVEDSPDNVEALALMDKPVIVFSNATNRYLDASLRADTWDEVERLVRDQVKLSGKMVVPPRSDEGPANEPA